MRCKAGALLGLCGLLAAAPASAGALRRFEKALGSKSRDTTFEKLNADTASDDSECSSVFACIVMLTFNAGTGATLDYRLDRERGSPTIPTFRLDAAYGRVYDNIDAYSVRAEAGWAVLGTAYEYLRFNEHDPPDILTTWYWEALYRIAPSPLLRFDWALGYRAFKRAGSHGGAHTGFSLGFYPHPSVGAEASFRWGSIADSTVSDYRGALLLRPWKEPGPFLRAGYRALRAGNVTLHGPEAGLSFFW